MNRHIDFPELQNDTCYCDECCARRAVKSIATKARNHKGYHEYIGIDPKGFIQKLSIKFPRWLRDILNIEYSTKKVRCPIRQMEIPIEGDLEFKEFVVGLLRRDGIDARLHGQDGCISFITCQIDHKRKYQSER